MTLMYREKELLGLLIECIEESRMEVAVMVPNNGYYYDSEDNCYESNIDVVNPYKLIEALRERLK